LCFAISSNKIENIENENELQEPLKININPQKQKQVLKKGKQVTGKCSI
jgi:hypothetical protein